MPLDIFKVVGAASEYPTIALEDEENEGCLERMQSWHPGRLL